MAINKIKIEYKNSWMSENKEEFINSVKYSRLATENIQLQLTSLSNPAQQNNDSYVNNVCNVYIETGNKTQHVQKYNEKNTPHKAETLYSKTWYNTEYESMRKSYFKRKHELSKTVHICEAADIQLNKLFEKSETTQIQYKHTFHSDVRTIRI